MRGESELMVVLTRNPWRFVTSTSSPPVGFVSARRSPEMTKRFSPVMASCPLSPKRVCACASPSKASKAKTAAAAAPRIRNELLTIELHCCFRLMGRHATTHEAAWELDKARPDGAGPGLGNRRISMANRAIWSMRLRHEWLKKPRKKAHLKKSQRIRVGLEDALQRKANKEGQPQTA